MGMDKYLRFKDLQAMGLVNNRVTLGRWIRKHGFPRGVFVTPQTRIWREEDVLAWLESRPATTTAGPRRN